MKLSGNKLNGKLFHEEDQGTKEECKQDAAKQTDDPLRIITGPI